tara:strand:+ start:1516 stop:1713 length:198 start_codon:yes stop_codon:yes gene_type:complete
MSHRTITTDPTISRRKAYERLEKEGSAQQALWEALATMKNNGIDIGEKADAMLTQRNQIKTSRPK